MIKPGLLVLLWCLPLLLRVGVELLRVLHWPLANGVAMPVLLPVGLLPA